MLQGTCKSPVELQMSYMLVAYDLHVTCKSNKYLKSLQDPHLDLVSPYKSRVGKDVWRWEGTFGVGKDVRRWKRTFGVGKTITLLNVPVHHTIHAKSCIS